MSGGLGGPNLKVAGIRSVEPSPSLVGVSSSISSDVKLIPPLTLSLQLFSFFPDGPHSLSGPRLLCTEALLL